MDRLYCSRFITRTTPSYGEPHKLYLLLRAGKTEIVSHPRTVSVDKFLDAFFNCTSITDEEELYLLNITWFHDGRPITDDSRRHVTQTMTSQTVHGQLRIYGVHRSDNGRYECGASAELDNATSQPAYLLIKGCSRIFVLSKRRSSQTFVLLFIHHKIHNNILFCTRLIRCVLYSRLRLEVNIFECQSHEFTHEMRHKRSKDGHARYAQACW